MSVLTGVEATSKSFKAVSRQFQEGFKEVPGGLEILTRVSQRSFKEVL